MASRNNRKWEYTPGSALNKKKKNNAFTNSRRNWAERYMQVHPDRYFGLEKCIYIPFGPSD